MKFKNNKGFTLVELLVVIGIMAVLAGAIIFLIDPVTQLQRSKDARRKADLRQIQSALELYRADQLAYPATLTCNTPLNGTVNGSTVTYMARVPCDPKNTAPYVYTYVPGSPASSYTLKTCLENKNDPDQDAKNGKPNSCAPTATSFSYTLLSP